MMAMHLQLFEVVTSGGRVFMMFDWSVRMMSFPLILTL
jgi:hypothetical protein